MKFKVCLPAQFSRLFALLLLSAAVAGGAAVPGARADAAQGTKLGPSGLPLPRFVSLKASRVNMRVGPGTQYAVEWLYLKAGLPMEIIQEYDNWRRVRDADGAEGWINQALLSGRRTGVVAPWLDDREIKVPLHAEPQESAPTVAQVEPGAVGEVNMCNGKWCRMTFSGHTGWMEQKSIWGVYPEETVAQ